MKIPFLYSFRNMRTRLLTTILTVSGMALVVFVFASIYMLSEGLKKTLVQTGSFDNVVAIRKGSNTEVQSSIERSQASLIETIEEIATSKDGNNFTAKEIVVIANLPKRDKDKPAQVIIRGIANNSLDLRPKVKIIQGRMPKEGSYEIIVGKNIAKKFKNSNIGARIRFAVRDWQVVGILDSGNSGFDSEIWGDVEQIKQAYKRPIYSSIIFRLKPNIDFEALKKRVESDPRLTVEIERETRFYEKQSEVMAKFLKILSLSLTIVFSLGAIIGAMITMYSAVASRIPEIGTLRAIGFSRTSILIAFLLEAALMGFIGGGVGLFLASFMQFFTVSTMNWQTFSEIAFTFALTFEISYKAIFFSVFMGLIGGLIPAINASKMKIVDTLRTV